MNLYTPYLHQKLIGTIRRQPDGRSFVFPQYIRHDDWRLTPIEGVEKLFPPSGSFILDESSRHCPLEGLVLIRLLKEPEPAQGPLSFRLSEQTTVFPTTGGIYMCLHDTHTSGEIQKAERIEQPNFTSIPKENWTNTILIHCEGEENLLGPYNHAEDTAEGGRYMKLTKSVSDTATYTQADILPVKLPAIEGVPANFPVSIVAKKKPVSYIGVAIPAPKGVNVRLQYKLENNGDLTPYAGDDMESFPEAPEQPRGLVRVDRTAGTLANISQFPDPSDEWLLGVERINISSLKECHEIGPWATRNHIPKNGSDFLVVSGNSVYGPFKSQGLKNTDKHWYLQAEASPDTAVNPLDGYEVVRFLKPGSEKPYHLLLVRGQAPAAKETESKQTPMPEWENEPEEAAVPKPDPAPQQNEKGDPAPQLQNQFGRDFCFSAQHINQDLQKALFLPQALEIQAPDDQRAIPLYLMQNHWVTARLADGISRLKAHLEPSSSPVAKETYPLLHWMHPYFRERLETLVRDYSILLDAYQNGRDVDTGTVQDKQTELIDPFYACEVMYFEDISRIYEYYCLQRIVKGLLDFGFLFESNERWDHASKKAAEQCQGSTCLANQISFRKEGMALTLYREPTIHSSRCIRGLELCCNKPLNDSHLSPDYVLKISGTTPASPAVYIIIDAKLQQGKTIKNSHTRTDYTNYIKPFRQRDCIGLVCTFQGRPDTKSKAYKGQADTPSDGKPVTPYLNCCVQENGDTMEDFWQEFRKLLS